MQPSLISLGNKPRTGVLRDCDTCSATFYVIPARIKTSRFCSRECRNKSVKKQAEKTCLCCGNVFTNGGTTRSYCSSKCYNKHRENFKFCLLCEKPLNPRSSKYCSTDCRARGRITRKEKPCENCGKVFSHEAATKARFCSIPCRKEGRKLKGPGAKQKRKDGYIAVYFPTHPDAGSNRHVLEHRLVMEQVLGRRLLRTEQVHHINGIRDDNRLENLQILSAADHSQISNKKGVENRKKMQDELEEYKKRFGPLA